MRMGTPVTGMAWDDLRTKALDHAVVPKLASLHILLEISRAGLDEKFRSQYLTIFGTTPSFGIGNALTGSEWKILTENRGSLADLFAGVKVSSSTGVFRFRCRIAANSALSSSHENRSLSEEVADTGLMGEVLTTRFGRGATG